MDCLKGDIVELMVRGEEREIQIISFKKADSSMPSSKFICPNSNSKIDLNNFIRNNELLNQNGQFHYALNIFRKDRNFIINIQNHGF